jgi:hypothetical protein
MKKHVLAFRKYILSNLLSNNSERENMYVHITEGEGKANMAKRLT